ncbi:hypothetical protein [Sphingomonas sp. SCN 67-18]|nr:hypothetical protein [Sphingomonas sp. SCN 67-18]
MIAIAPPCSHDGVGRALRQAFREPVSDVPADWLDCLARLR